MTKHTPVVNNPMPAAIAAAVLAPALRDTHLQVTHATNEPRTPDTLKNRTPRSDAKNQPSLHHLGRIGTLRS
jgi:hypothetical protein